MNLHPKLKNWKKLMIGVNSEALVQLGVLLDTAQIILERNKING